MVVEKWRLTPILLAAGTVFLASCATETNSTSDAGPEREIVALSENDFENVMGIEETAASAAIEPAAAVLPARFYTVYFDLGSDSLSEAGEQIVKDIAADWTTGQANLKLIGHTDSSGSRAYNQKLSERRAGSVRDALIELGIAADRVIDGGAGESDLLVPTGDGVADRHNRRVTVTVE